MATQNDEWWMSEFGSKEEAPGPVDYLSRDSRSAIEVKTAVSGSRALRSAVLGLAIYVEQNPQIQRACLVLVQPRMSHERVVDEWEAAKSVLRPAIARRLGLIAVKQHGSWVSSDEQFLRSVAAHFERNLSDRDRDLCEPLSQPPGQKSYEVVKVLLNRWLQHLGPIAVGDLADDVGCSYPTVRKVLDETQLQKCLRIASNRSVELKSFPHDAWRELVVLSAKLRRSFRFRDRSGERPSPQSLLRRLERIKPPSIAVGGVISARYWHPDFDLHGTPRIDLLYHAPNGSVEFNFVQKLDPALTESDNPSESSILVIHPLVRAASLFVERPGNVPLADPVETALDLNDLSLTMQANQLLTHLRTEVRLA